MPRELVTVQVGQAGNQIGCRFWELALREHAAANPGGVYDEPLSSFFRNVDTRSDPPTDLAVGRGDAPIRSLRARAVVVDMEEGVVAGMMRGPLGQLFDAQQLLYDVSGAGNNWAHGRHGYGPRYRAALSAQLRRAAEQADSLQGFLLLHSLGGGTGSGLGSYLLDLMADDFPEVLRVSAPVFPSEDDDVVTSPYNALLSAWRLIEAADCVLPVENQALAAIAARVEASAAPASSGGSAGGGGSSNKERAAAAGGAAASGGRAWGAMNRVAAELLLQLTSSVRFEGSLNTDLSDLTVNLVPYPRLHFLLSAMAPLPQQFGGGAAGGGGQLAPRGVDQLFTDVFSRSHQLLSADGRAHTHLATALMMRGRVSLGDAQRNLARLRPGLRLAPWTSEGFKLGLCAQPPVGGAPASLLALSNNCALGETFAALLARFEKLYRRRLFVHHYAEFMDAEAAFSDAAACVADLVADYRAADAAPQPPIVRLRPRGVGFE